MAHVSAVRDAAKQRNLINYLAVNISLECYCEVSCSGSGGVTRETPDRISEIHAKNLPLLSISNLIY